MLVPPFVSVGTLPNFFFHKYATRNRFAAFVHTQNYGFYLMLTLPHASDAVDTFAYLDNLLVRQFLPDYVYSYPPRQAFRQDWESTYSEDLVFDSLSSRPPNYNIYLHFPFCKQICGYCNLFAVGVPGDDKLIDAYIQVLEKEIATYTSHMPHLTPNTIYFGGGTPSLLSTAQLERSLYMLERFFPAATSTAEEICIEVDPGTLTQNNALHLRNVGFTRISLGAQSFDDAELGLIGRQYHNQVVRTAIAAALTAGIADVCVDLIIGLPGQTDDSWKRSVLELLRFRPPTICTYHLTRRLCTGFSNKGLATCASPEKYRRYRWAQEQMLNSGYQQETNVRYVLPGVGGYRQKVNHWKGGVVHGFGAGARTYSPQAHYVNGYSVTARSQALRKYLEDIKVKGSARTEGFRLDAVEQAHQRLVLMLNQKKQDIAAAGAEAGISDHLSRILDFMLDRGMISENFNNYEYTTLGYEYRDIFAHSLFSSDVRNAILNYRYDS
jgi:oxygen-independent coproporphyrinogen III oxidase